MRVKRAYKYVHERCTEVTAMVADRLSRLRERVRKRAKSVWGEEGQEGRRERGKGERERERERELACAPV